MKLAVFGSGGIGRVTSQIAQWENETKHLWDEILYVDDGIDEGEFQGLRTMHFNTAKSIFQPNEVEFVVALGDPATKRRVFRMIEDAGFGFGRVIAPNACAYPTAKLGRSVILSWGACAEPDCEIGDGVVLDTFSAVGHDVKVGDFCHIGSKCNIGGGGTIGQGTFIGLHAITKEGLSIGEYVTVGMGSVVIRDIPDKKVAVGNPARVIKDRDEDTKVL